MIHKICDNIVLLFIKFSDMKHSVFQNNIRLRTSNRNPVNQVLLFSDTKQIL